MPTRIKHSYGVYIIYIYIYIYRFYNENVKGIVKKRFSAKVFIVKSVVKSEPSRMYVLEELLEQ